MAEGNSELRSNVLSWESSHNSGKRLSAAIGCLELNCCDQNVLHLGNLVTLLLLAQETGLRFDKPYVCGKSVCLKGDTAASGHRRKMGIGDFSHGARLLSEAIA